MPADSTLFQAPAQLLSPITNPQTNEPGFAFPLQTDAWIEMQAVVVTAMSFPLTTDDFTALYGAFSDEAKVVAASTLLGNIKTTADQYGDPTTLIDQIAAFQQAATPPDAIYGHMVWLAAQTVANAQQVSSLLDAGLKDIATETDPAVRLQDLKDLLAGTGGIQSIATTLNGYIAALETKITAFYDTLNGYLKSLEDYMKQDGNIVQDARDDAKLDADTIDALHDDIDKLNKEYIAFTVCASSAPLFGLIPIIGVVIAVADGATFGALAAKVKSQIESDRNAIESAEEDKAEKYLLVSQLTGFNRAIANVDTDGESFISKIKTLAAGWAEFETAITTNLASLTVEDVTDWSKFQQMVHFDTARASWDRIATTAETFYDTGFAKFTKQS